MFYFGLSRKPFIHHIHTYFGFTKKNINSIFIPIFLGQKICLFPNGSLSWWRIVDHSPRQRYANKEYIFYDYILVSRKMIFFFPGHFDDLTTRFYVACVVSALGNNNLDEISNLVPI